MNTIITLEVSVSANLLGVQTGDQPENSSIVAQKQRDAKSNNTLQQIILATQRWNRQR